MSDEPNRLIDKRLKNIENRIARLAFLHAHLKKFKEDEGKLNEYSRTIEGVSLFYYYSFSQFILELNKLFDDDIKEYFTLPKLLNHIESNIKDVHWCRLEYEYSEPTKKQLETGKVIWSSGKENKWNEKAIGAELIVRKKLISDLKLRITKNKKDIKEIKLARDKVIAHLDKDFLNHNFNIELEIVEKLLHLALEIFNTLNYELKGSSLNIDCSAIDTLSTLVPITKFYQLRGRIRSIIRTKKKTIEIEELNEIIK